MDVLIGAVAASFIIFCTETLTQTERKKTWLLRPLESRMATGLGLFSYSIYLMSLPIETKLRVALMHVCHSGTLINVLMFVIGAPVTLALCYFFHLAFERRFMRNLSLPKKVSGEVFLTSKANAEETSISEPRGGRPAPGQ